MGNYLILPQSVLSRALAGGFLGGVLLAAMGLTAWIVPCSTLVFLSAAFLSVQFEHPSTPEFTRFSAKAHEALAYLRRLPAYARAAIAITLTLSAILLNLAVEADPREHAYLSISAPIVVSAILFGFEIAGLAMLLACIASLYYFIPPNLNFAYAQTRDFKGLFELVAFDIASANARDLERLFELAAFVFLSSWFLKSMFERAALAQFATPVAAGATIAAAQESARLGAQQGLRDALERNREMRHRVKNEFQALCLLASTEAAKSDRPDEFRRWVLRLRSAARLHELMDGDEAESVPMRRYLVAISDALQKTYSGRLEIETRVDADIEFDYERARKIGLICAEAAMNALKHGFSDRAGGRLEVRLRRVDRRFELTVADDGVGFDPDATEAGFGVGLMKGLAESLGGLLHFEGRQGCATVRCVF